MVWDRGPPVARVPSARETGLACDYSELVLRKTFVNLYSTTGPGDQAMRVERAQSERDYVFTVPTPMGKISTRATHATAIRGRMKTMACCCREGRRHNKVDVFRIRFRVAENDGAKKENLVPYHFGWYLPKL